MEDMIASNLGNNMLIRTNLCRLFLHITKEHKSGTTFSLQLPPCSRSTLTQSGYRKPVAARLEHMETGSLHNLQSTCTYFLSPTPIMFMVQWRPSYMEMVLLASRKSTVRKASQYSPTLQSIYIFEFQPFLPEDALLPASVYVKCDP